MSGGKEQGPAHQAGLNYGEEYAGKFVDINPLNQEAYPNQKPSPDQPFNLPTERQVQPMSIYVYLIVLIYMWYVWLQVLNYWLICVYIAIFIQIV